ncbi:ret finger protein-like 4B [Suricata suricatta]|uniref:ret finger protein-like 4B n=1 Tax=Suricata suricatta TaxID=37032 RepID=UPI0011552F06|nr:ret finger protein-like 4B [Suricata suricatta]
MALSLQEELTCPVCLEISLTPVSLSCTHIFCFPCVHRWMLEDWERKVTCPVCREESDRTPAEDLIIGGISLLFTQHPALLKKSLHVSSELLRFWEDMTLDPSTAHSFPILSEDLRSVRCGNVCHNPLEDPERFAYLACVLGTQCFSSGRHYWEVEVGKGEEWTLGICKQSVDQKRKDGFTSEKGFWFISKKAETIYTGSNPETSLPASPELRHVGIFLDVEMEEVKFFDVQGNALIYTHSHLSCVEPLRPFFCPELPREGDSGASMKICS